MGHRREAVDIEELVLECNFFCRAIANLYSGDDCDNTVPDYYVYERNDQHFLRGEIAYYRCWYCGHFDLPLAKFIGV